MNGIFSWSTFDSVSSASLTLAELAKGPTGYFLAFLGIGLFIASITIAIYLAKILPRKLSGGVKQVVGGRKYQGVIYAKGGNLYAKRFK